MNQKEIEQITFKCISNENNRLKQRYANYTAQQLIDEVSD